MRRGSRLFSAFKGRGHASRDQRPILDTCEELARGSFGGRLRRTIPARGFSKKGDPTVHLMGRRSRYKTPISPLNPSLVPSVSNFSSSGEKEMEAERTGEGWQTPKRGECRIPAELQCPPPPRKRSPAPVKRREPPKGGYFLPPDLEVLFALAPRRGVCV